eukprot:m.226118 g.226118  ORF g.226118 m.226118 type:complete len:865 (+) comp13863_c5_seq4:6572-9166(+)
MSGNADNTLIVDGRVGHADFINGKYTKEEELVNNKPAFRSDHFVPEEYESAAGCSLYIYFHEDNDAWVISHELNSLDVLAYCPSHIKNIWHVATGKGPFVPDPTVKLIGGNGEVLTRLGPWTVEPSGEVALKMEASPEPGSERPMTIVDVVKLAADRYPEENAIAHCNSNDGNWAYRSFSDLYTESLHVARAFTKLGLRKCHSVAILGTNAPEWSIASIAAIMAGGFACGVFETTTVDNLDYICENARADIVVVDTNSQLQKVLEVKERLGIKAIVQYLGYPDGDESFVYSWSDIVSMGRDVPRGGQTEQEVEERMASLRANRCAIIAYTPGTSTDPKGVMLSHDNITWTAQAVARSLETEPLQDRIVSYLPLASVSVQMFDIWIPLVSVSTVYYGAPKPMIELSFMETMMHARPTLFASVPWIWSRVQEKAQEAKKLSAWAARKGSKGSVRLQKGESVNWKFKMANKTFVKIKKAIGLDECRLSFCIDANVLPSVAEYFLSINMPIYEAYGAAECSGWHTISLPKSNRPASAGKPFPGVQVRMTHGSHEVLVYGRHVMMGYIQDPELTSEAVDERGWLHTRDIGQADRSGFLYVTGRLDDLILTAGGSHVPPGPLETTLKKNLRGLVSNAVVIGNKRKTLGVLLVLDTELNADFSPTDNLSAEAISVMKELGSTATTVPQCLNGSHTDVLFQFVEKALDLCNEAIASVDHKVMKFEFISRGFSRETLEYGPTFKLRRKFIEHRHGAAIERMYAGEVVEDYHSEKWYHGPITRKEVEQLIKRDGGGYDGWYLVRISTKEKNTFVVSLFFKGRLYHNQVRYADGVYNTHKDQGNHQYNSLLELINHHKEGKNGFQCVLTRYCAKK